MAVPVTAVRRGHDPSCRYARAPEHLCINNRGDAVFEGQECFAETRAQVLEQGHVLHMAEGATR